MSHCRGVLYKGWLRVPGRAARPAMRSVACVSVLIGRSSLVCCVWRFVVVDRKLREFFRALTEFGCKAFVVYVCDRYLRSET